jgi:hypothetical protein
VETKIGVIKKASFGLGGYQECELGLSLTLDFKGSGVCAWVGGGWATKRSEYTKWTEEDRAKQQASLCTKLIELLNDAKIRDVSNLTGKPVECVFEGNTLKDWRLLTEAIL